MLTSDILRRKRLRAILSMDEINFLINGAVNGKISNAQITAFLTSSCINGLNEDETAFLTESRALLKLW